MRVKILVGIVKDCQFGRWFSESVQQKIYIFHAVGTLTAFMDMLNMWVSEGVMDSAVPFNMRPEMPSGPDALVVSIAHNKQNTSHTISSLTGDDGSAINW